MRYLIVSLTLLFGSALLVTNLYMPMVIRQAPPTATFPPTAPGQSLTFATVTPTPPNPSQGQP